MLFKKIANNTSDAPTGLLLANQDVPVVGFFLLVHAMATGTAGVLITEYHASTLHAFVLFIWLIHVPVLCDHKL
jgi:hypothetical protein